MPPGFFDTVVRPAFVGGDGIVYILPEVRSDRDVFTVYRTAAAADTGR